MNVDAQLETIKSIQPPILIRERGDGTFVIDRWQFEYDPNWPMWEQPEWPKPAPIPIGMTRAGVTWR